MGLEELALSGQRTIDQGAILKQRIEDGNQCALVVVPPQAELLIVIHE